MDMDFNFYLKNVLCEDFYGMNAIVYHRTKKQNIESIAQNGFTIGNGANYYGKGFYCTYKIESLLDEKMEMYGDVIIKCKVNVYNCIILDYVESKKLFKDKYKLTDQISKNDINDKIIELSNKLETANKLNQFIIARELLTEFPQIVSKSNGMFFQEYREGFVGVIYNPQIIIPISYVELNDNQISGEWKSMMSDENIKKSSEKMKEIFYQNKWGKDFKYDDVRREKDKVNNYEN